VADRYVGLISGTSMDGLDAALVEIEGDHARLLEGLTRPLPAGLGDELRALAAAESFAVDRIGELDAWLGELFADAALAVIGENDARNAVRAIGSHGQTVRHRPRASWPFTLQLADPNRIAARTGITTVADFRRRDMALGGEGAPLVPAFHQAQFSGSDSRVVLNLGGIGNVTVLQPDRAVTGWDTGPGNTLMDAWARRHLRRSFDEGGEWARSGRVLPDLLERMLSHPYLRRSGPKSTGPEEFSTAWMDAMLTAAGSAPDPRDVQATLCELTARTVADSVAASAPVRMFVCGGGAQNAYLMSRLAAALPKTSVETTSALGIDPRWVEAAAFAWLAARTLHHRPGNLPSVTGARRAAVLGAVYPA
jgi:anhydro-N-acetylmuramic acid kinase